MVFRGYSGRLGCIKMLSEIINPLPNDLRETMGRRYHQKYKQYKQSRINRNGLIALCYLVQVIWK